MVEVELKYAIKTVPSNLKKYDLIMNKEETDIYYDTKDYNLIKNGHFFA